MPTRFFNHLFLLIFTLYCPIVTAKTQVTPKPTQVSSDQKPCVPSKHKCPEPEITYKPTFPPLGKYSVPNVCQANFNLEDPPTHQITLKNGQSLQDAYDQLRVESNNAGGIINIPWDVDTIQCDNLRVGRDKIVTKLMIRGIPGPKGEQPRFYCRDYRRDGTITTPGGGWVGDFMVFGYGWKSGRPAPGNYDLVVENLHIDGYGSAFIPPNSGHAVFRNNYFHHQISNGTKVYGIDPGSGPGWGVTLEFCGNEVSHSGNGNAHHGFYMGRSREYDYGEDGLIKMVVVDNLMHSCAWSSCYKSLANRNFLSGNRFYKQLDTDPSYTRMYSQMLVDIPACSKTRIENNLFDKRTPYTKPPYNDKSPGGVSIGIRNRQSMYGCNEPLSYEKVDRKGPYKKYKPVEGSPFWDPKWWAKKNGEKDMRWDITGNTFVARYPGQDGGAIRDWGTFPNYEVRQFGPSCLMPPEDVPEGWYERHRAYVYGNKYIDYSPNLTHSETPTKNFKPECPPYLGPKPDNDLIEVGEGNLLRQ